ncbi:MAG: NUDIX hydrolase [Candidatus Collierbacteria bacterium GW2011_GWB1_44_6]|uniref:NUDIX hydrolase n=2 Tax=Candidatus Collieribacteriota TaxID=1752725 RepID=A0A0G1JNW7_9BACT|nr:MAG: NUDIX hydrolase [Candidatus Collierbacteria bacterium GW2011_GWC2_43_12]KKT73070.1 MAG: NUDIX hydrolase [Candidatus Collierbacteria bacterium GW2011_GWB1_44_6]KKT83205.1 MAG: NUDIX hydrolase [Microgenomates group bacterium GW2011_GWC1_44_9]
MNLLLEFLQILIKNLPRGIVPGSLVIVYKETVEGKKFLVIKNMPSGSIAFPSGTISWWENYEKTARRELYEETGIRVKTLVEIPILHKFRYKQIFLKLKSEQHIFLYELKKPKDIRLHSKETAWFKWVTSQQAEKIISHTELIKSFRESLRYLLRDPQ